MPVLEDERTEVKPQTTSYERSARAEIPEWEREAFERDWQTRRPALYLSAGAILEVIGGVGAIVLAVIGLTGILPRLMYSIAAIAVGGGLLFESAAIASRFSEFLYELRGGPLSRFELGGGVLASFVGGLGGVTLGILALLGVVPLTLVAVAAIAMGGAFVLNSGATISLNHLAIGKPREENRRVRILHESTSAVSAVQVLFGLGAVVLGILSLVGIVPLTLNLVAMLVLGATAFLVGAALISRMLMIYRYR